MYYINYFFIFSILGHALETFFYTNGDGGILISYWTPIYGFGVLIILFIHKYLDKHVNKYNNVKKILILFLVSSIILATIEMIGGYLIKFIFNKELWDYTNHLFNIGKYTSLDMAIVWGICSIVLIYLIKPLIDKAIYTIPRYFTYILIILFVLDIIVTVYSKII